ncbi:response regulator transcription factor [Acidovorax sp. HDW3]|uniref:response regulator transcription factor n=1 Tax=Acidovorax sp. HDW3 TaxID=2714923 RepID=UPI001F0CEBB3|nr:response regulator [Acidovorax sp. HDW3]
MNNATVFIVDDDAAVREALAWLLRSRRLHSETFASAEAFASALQERWPLGHSACLLLDIRMGGMSGLTLFDQLLAQDRLAGLPVIFLTGHADVRTAVDTVKRGAFDFFEKPFSDNALVDRIEQALALSSQALVAQQAEAQLELRLKELTDRERDVMALVVAALPNKLIADQLGISVRTVEVHRARVFDKMQVKSAVELANLLRGAEGADDQPRGRSPT